jgi:hypothetical protein
MIVKIETIKTLHWICYVFAKLCHKALIKNKRIYSWYWIILPNWRWYLCKYGEKYYKERYSTPSIEIENPPKMNRKELFITNGYKYKLMFWKQK